MKSTPINFDHFGVVNKSYNEALLAASDDTAFVTNRFEELGYIPVGKNTKKRIPM